MVQRSGGRSTEAISRGVKVSKRGDEGVARPTIATAKRATPSPNGDKAKAILKILTGGKTMSKLKITLRTETKERTIVTCDLTEELGMPWVFKMGSDQLRDVVKKAKDEYNERKGDWFRTVGEEIIAHMSYKPMPESPFGWDTVQFNKACEIVFDAIREEYVLAKNPPKQKTIAEA